MEGAGWVLAAAVAFVGTHFVLSHPLRRPIVAAVGDRGFSGIYSLIALEHQNLSSAACSSA